MITGNDILFPIKEEDYKKVKEGLKFDPKPVGFGRFARVCRVDDIAVKIIFPENEEQQTGEF